MKLSIDTVYLLILVFGTVVLMWLLQSAQRLTLTKLQDTLYRQNNPRKYLHMLQRRWMGLVFRKGTILLLELDGRLLIDDMTGLRKLYDKAAVTRMNRNEKLDMYLKLFNYYVKTGENELARGLYSCIELLLKNEKDEKLKLVLSDAKLLIGIYVEKDINLIPSLNEQLQKQSGSMQGMTGYRLAKLYWYAHDKEKALDYLNFAKEKLAGTAWEPLILQAINQPDILETV